MIKITYLVPAGEKDNELEWLQDQKIFPAVQETWTWDSNGATKLFRFGVIVGSEAALSIKLRHNLEHQAPYRQR